MATDFLHGVEVLEIDAGPRPIQVARSSVIGLIGTAPDADANTFPYNTATLISGSRQMAGKLDTTGNGLGTLPSAMDGIFDQTGAVVVVVRVQEGADDAATQANVVGGTDGNGEHSGLKVFLEAQSELGFTPRLLCAPGFSHQDAVAAEMEVVANRLRGMAILDGPNSTDAAAIARVDSHGSRCYLVDPWVKVFDTVAAAEKVEPASAHVCGLIARTDNELGFWHSPSNKAIYGIIGLGRPIDFVLGDKSARANLLNGKHVTTIIRHDGFRLWGNRNCNTSDTKWMYLSVRRTADIINDSILAAHLWAVDKNNGSAYLEAVTEGVNAFMRSLEAQGALIGGHCYADPDLNSPASIQLGQAWFNFEFTPPFPAERVIFRSHLVNDYLEEIA
ncbi:phage tail sheath subtilisin-like domain-containing protein [Candidatus Sororendozoicomonas aggregata]|uniref:phage tail sheath subtilisin-like domain-containing protein n=1 Tax=Candidatus Sororendozoicomonas aggregata TaxID=3073239 RepID=UPI002ED3A3C3